MFLAAPADSINTPHRVCSSSIHLPSIGARRRLCQQPWAHCFRNLFFVAHSTRLLINRENVRAPRNQRGVRVDFRRIKSSVAASYSTSPSPLLEIRMLRRPVESAADSRRSFCYFIRLFVDQSKLTSLVPNSKLKLLCAELNRAYSGVVSSTLHRAYWPTRLYPPCCDAICLKANRVDS